MLKKTGIAVAVATAGLLALSPLAFADDVDQERNQQSFQDNGIDRGNQIGHGNERGGCGGSIGGWSMGSVSDIAPGEDCNDHGESIGSKTEQAAKNSDDKGGSYDKDDRESDHAS